MEAEQGLCKLAVDTGMDVVIIRPVLVHGPGVKANIFEYDALVRQRSPSIFRRNS
jgi:nucleoside-diphosphate-sugar epimerase